MVPDKADSYQTIAPKQLLRLGYMRFLPPKPVPGVARTIKMASIDRQCGIVGGGGVKILQSVSAGTLAIEALLVALLR